jgi:flagellar hook assembly protein FlgD
VLWNSAYADELVYPNPFVQETRIEFSVAQADRLHLLIVDERGTPVRRLLHDYPVPVGQFQVTWDGHTDAGQAAPAGVYFYQVQGQRGGSGSGKVVLVRP